MSDRTELLEAALDILPEGIALSDLEGRVALWNRAAEEITGHRSTELAGRPVREALDALIVGGMQYWITKTDAESVPGRSSLVRVRHRLGHELPAMARVLVLRDGLGARIGAGVIFHPANDIDGLPHGQVVENISVCDSQAQIEDRLTSLHEDFTRGNTSFGVLWITVDQASSLRGTHGARACEAMLEKVERALAGGLRAAEEIGRWGDNEFLVLSHERNATTLAAHAQLLAGLARTTDFRWWGDRVSITVSVGAAQAEEGELLNQLLERAQTAMRSSIHSGGNHIEPAQGRIACLPS